MKLFGIRVVVAMAAVLVTAWWLQVGRDNPCHADPGGMEADLTEASRRFSDEAGGFHGIAWQIHHAEHAVFQAGKLLPEIAALGADTVLISNAGYQRHAGSESFRIDPNVTPSPEQWQEIFRIARDNKLRVILMPIILLSHPRGSEWRGVIQPPSWNDWFDQYRSFIRHFAEIAADGKVEVLMVGSELVSTEKYTEQWKRVIRDVRDVYRGRLSYSANWDHYKVIQFWGELDYVGMTSYYKLASRENPSLAELIEAWKPINRGLVRWQQRIGKPLLFTEVGWCSQSGTAIEPWNYYYDQKSTPEALEEQRRCYRAFMETFRNDLQPQLPTDQPVVGGIIWWEWTDTAGGPEDFNYTPRGKPAEKELREWFAEVGKRRSPPATTTAPAE